MTLIEILTIQLTNAQAEKARVQGDAVAAVQVLNARIADLNTMITQATAHPEIESTLKRLLALGVLDVTASSIT